MTSLASAKSLLHSSLVLQPPKIWQMYSHEGLSPAYVDDSFHDTHFRFFTFLITLALSPIFSVSLRLFSKKFNTEHCFGIVRVGALSVLTSCNGKLPLNEHQSLDSSSQSEKHNRMMCDVVNTCCTIQYTD